MAKKSIFTLVLLAFTLSTYTISYADVYKSIDEDGRITFGDQPQTNATKIEIRPPNTIAPIETVPSLPESSGETSELTTDDGATAYQMISIIEPDNNTIIPNGLSPFNVVVRMKPKLIKGHLLQLILDGNPSATSKNTTIQVKSINRGQHSLQVAIVDSSGNRLKQSRSISIFAYRP